MRSHAGAGARPAAASVPRRATRCDDAPPAPASTPSRREALLLSSLAAVTCTPVARSAAAAATPAAAAAAVVSRSTTVGGTRVAAVGAGSWQWGNTLLWQYDPAQDGALRDTFDVLVAGTDPMFIDTADSCAPLRLERARRAALPALR
jgi:hypothetical protein